jgi:hypothetical protein
LVFSTSGNNISCISSGSIFSSILKKELYIKHKIYV